MRYRHGPDAIARAPERPAGILYVVGATKVVANNGAAGMPNMAGTRFGILTRIANGPAYTLTALATATAAA